MKCKRCEGVMREELLLVSGGTIKIKGVSAWHCLDCGRIEYRTTVTNRFIIEEADHPMVHFATRG